MTAPAASVASRAAADTGKRASRLRDLARDIDSTYDEMDRLNARRETLALEALGFIEREHKALGDMLVLQLASRQRAARWLCTRQRALDHQSPLDCVLAGALDDVWDLLAAG